MNPDWGIHRAAIWRARQARLRPVRYPDPVRLGDLLGVEAQKQKLVHNIERFLGQRPCNHVLLSGARGTGKSSLVKALPNEYGHRGLRLIQVDRDELADLADIVDDIRERPQRFVLYCDDLTFEAGDPGYRHLKSVLEGSIELPPENVLLHVTSNRRHMVPEYRVENANTRVEGGEIHHGDSVEEKISLADRFGLHLSFHPISEAQYFEMVDCLFPEVTDRKALHAAARRFSIERGGRSGRVARQFYNHCAGEFEE